jgi:hypothetical protein
MQLTAKSSTIYIATASQTSIYHSVQDVPMPLRRKLEESTSGLNSATILIADQRGREELVRALQGKPSGVQSRLADAIRAHQVRRSPAPLAKSRRRLSLRSWLEILLPAAVGASLWIFFELHP